MQKDLKYFRILSEQLNFVKMTMMQRKDVNDALEMIEKQLTIPVVSVSLCVLRCFGIQYINKKRSNITVIEMRGSFFFRNELDKESQEVSRKGIEMRNGLSAGMLGKSVKPPYGAYFSRVGLER